jgi:hypothetical protein
VKALPHFEAGLAVWPAEREDAELAALLLEFASAKYHSDDYATDAPPIERGLALAERLRRLRFDRSCAMAQTGSLFPARPTTADTASAVQAG